MGKIVIALFLTLMHAGLALAGRQDFTIVNNTGKELVRMYVSPAAREEWGTNILAAKSLATGEERDFLVEREGKAEVWDLLVLSSDGTTLKWPGLRLNDFSAIFLGVDNGRPVASFE